VATPETHKSEAAIGCSLEDIQIDELDAGVRIEPERDALDDSMQSKQEYHSWSDRAGEPDKVASQSAAKASQAMDVYIAKLKKDGTSLKHHVKHRRKVSDDAALSAAIKQARKQKQAYVEIPQHPSAKDDSDSMSLSQ